MKNLFLFIATALCTGSVSAQELSAKLEEYMQARVKQNKFNGVVLVAKDGKVLLHKGYGWRDAQKRIPHDEQSIFQIGSITKQFTATIVLYLQERGKLNVQDKLSKYIPDYPQGDKIAIHHLLTHTSGIFNYTNNSSFMNTEVTKPIAIEKLVDVFRDKPLDFEPGSKFSYSNSGYILLGYIIQKVSGKSYEQMVREVIFHPLQMQQSGFDFTALNSAGKSIGYLALNTDTVVSRIVDSSVSYAAGAIYSTAGDLYKWHKGLYTEKTIKQSSFVQAYTPFKNKYGYGWGIDTLNGKRVISHNGGIFGFVSDMWRVPADSACIIILSNRPDELNVITRNLFAIIYNQPYEIPRERKIIEVPESTLQQYVGEYELSPTFKVSVTLENGKLRTQATNQQKIDLFAERENFFFMKVVNAQVEFLKNAEGKVDRLVIYQGGKEQTARRIE
ncbi:MAG: serine hydrolase [Chitinophagaceae bacterium]